MHSTTVSPPLKGCKIKKVYQWCGFLLVCVGLDFFFFWLHSIVKELNYPGCGLNNHFFEVVKLFKILDAELLTMYLLV